MRLLGKREVGSLSAFDLIVTLILGETVDEVIFGSVPVREGLTAIAVVAALHFGVSWLSFRSPLLRRIVEGQPTALIAKGRILRRGLRSERVSESELWSLLRVEGISESDLQDLERVQLEPDGKVSVLRKPAAEPAKRRDLRGSSRR